MNVDLVGLGLAAKWPKLLKLEHDRAKFQQRHQKAAQQVQTLTAHVPRAHNADLDASAAAVRQGRKPPEPTHEPAAQRDLERAIRERDVLARTVQAVEEEYGNYLAQHQTQLLADVLQARHAVAREAAKSAQEALRSYSRWADLATTIKALTPAPPSLEGQAAQRLTQSFAGAFTARPSGIPRGTVEHVLGYLVCLAPQEQGGDDAAA